MNPLVAKPAGAACAQCPGRDAICVRPEPANGKARLAIIGEAPGRDEVEELRPFVGASGRMLMNGLKTIGVRRDDVHWTNAVLCDVEKGDLPAARKACQARLTAELEVAKADLVVPVGAFGLQGALAVGRKPQILKWRGSVNERSRKDGSKYLICPTLHPAFVMPGRSPAWGPILGIDIARIGRVLDQGFRAPEADPRRKIVVARNLDILRERLPQLSGDAIGADVETLGLGPLVTPLVCFALSDGKLTIVVPWSKDQSGATPWWKERDRSEVVELVNKELAQRIVVTHNGPAFDFLVFDRYGIKIKAWDDSLLIAHVLAGHLPKRLQHVVSLYLDVHAWKEDDHAETIEKLWLYNARDTLYTILAYRVAKQKLKEAA